MPVVKSSSSMSSTGSMCSTSSPNTADSGKSMHAIAKAVTETDSRIEAWSKSPRSDDPYMFGQHGGKRIWDLNNKIIDLDQVLKSGPTTRRN